MKMLLTGAIKNKIYHCTICFECFIDIQNEKYIITILIPISATHIHTKIETVHRIRLA